MNDIKKIQHWEIFSDAEALLKEGGTRQILKRLSIPGFYSHQRPQWKLIGAHQISLWEIVISASEQKEQIGLLFQIKMIMVVFLQDHSAILFTLIWENKHVNTCKQLLRFNMKERSLRKKKTLNELTLRAMDGLVTTLCPFS